MDWRSWGTAASCLSMLAVMSALLNLNIDNVFDLDCRQCLDQNQGPGLNARIGMTLGFGVAAAETAGR
jgi:hypothetical protein